MTKRAALSLLARLKGLQKKRKKWPLFADKNTVTSCDTRTFIRSMLLVLASWDFLLKVPDQLDTDLSSIVSTQRVCNKEGVDLHLDHLE